MNERENIIKSVSNEFANWEVKIANLNSINMFDVNIVSENIICELLNIIFGYKLININSTNLNQTAIDLGDRTNRIAFQITSTKTSKKIQSTVNKFLENKFDQNYDELFFLILGKKQKKYSGFITSNEFDFDIKKHILDFKDLLRHISFLPISKLRKINKIIQDGSSQPRKSNTKSKATRIKRNLALKKRIQKDFILKLEDKHWRRAIYEPIIKFNYRQVIIRSVENDTFPEDNSKPNEMSNWFKADLWDFYDNGIEILGHGGRAIFDNNGNWDILKWENDKRNDNSKYRIVPFNDFLRIPYDFIVEYDMDTDPYYGLPAIYVEYAKDGMPYEEIIHGIVGNCEKEITTYYFEKEKRKKLK